MHTCIHACTCTCMCTIIHIYTHICVHACTCVYVYIARVFVHIIQCLHMHTCMLYGVDRVILKFTIGNYCLSNLCNYCQYRIVSQVSFYMHTLDLQIPYSCNEPLSSPTILHHSFIASGIVYSCCALVNNTRQ